MAFSNQPPPHRYYPDSPSVIQADMVVAWKRRRGVYNFDVLPSTALICLDHTLLRRYRTWGSRRLKGLKGAHFVRKGLLFCAEFGNGAPAVISLMEELKALGVRRFLFVGVAGAIQPGISSGSVFGISHALSGTGVTGYYTDLMQIDAPNGGAPGNDFNTATAFSTDAPFRETQDLLAEARLLGASLIDMETAAIYAFARYHNLPAYCFLVAADQLAGDWTPPGNYSAVVQGQRQIIDQLVQKLS